MDSSTSGISWNTAKPQSINRNAARQLKSTAFRIRSGFLAP